MIKKKIVFPYLRKKKLEDNNMRENDDKAARVSVLNILNLLNNLN